MHAVGTRIEACFEIFKIVGKRISKQLSNVVPQLYLLDLCSQRLRGSQKCTFKFVCVIGRSIFHIQVSELVSQDTC